MFRLLLSMLLWIVVLAVPATASEPVYANYRGTWLGESVSVVVTHFKMTLADVETTHQPPTLVQRLTWRPHRFVLDPTVAAPSLDEMEFTFHRGRLVRIVVTYDADRTEGLTDADLREAFTATYGSPALMSTRPMAAAEVVQLPAPPAVVGQWGDGDTLVLLSRLLYPRRVVLTITAIADDRAMETAVTAATQVYSLEAPARELAQRTLDVNTLRIQSETARRKNKASFTP